MISKTIGYLSNNQARMDYPRYRRQGLPIISGRVESLIKQFNRRVKGTEKFWNEDAGRDDPPTAGGQPDRRRAAEQTPEEPPDEPLPQVSNYADEEDWVVSQKNEPLLTPTVHMVKP